MTLTDRQQKLVEDNIGLVGRVIKDKVHGVNQIGIYSYDDLYQIGCFGLCKAAATDNGGCFSTYAYRLIWNSICDALIYATKRQNTEILTADGTISEASNSIELFSEMKYDLDAAIKRAKELASPSVKKGIAALVLLSQDYSSDEVGKKLHISPNVARAMASKARKYLRSRPEIRRLKEDYAI